MEFPIRCLRYDPQWHLIICCQHNHQHAILPSSLKRHLQSRKYHPEASSAQISATIAKATNITNLVQSWREIPRITQPIPMIPGLRVHRDAIQCIHPACCDGTQLGVIYAGENRYSSINKHFKEEHDLESRLSKTKPTYRWTIDVFAQRLTSSPSESTFTHLDPSKLANDPQPPQSYFAILQDTEQSEIRAGGSTTSHQQDRLDRLDEPSSQQSTGSIDGYMTLARQHEQYKAIENAALPTAHSRQTAPWILRCQILRVLQPEGSTLEWGDITHLVSVPNKDTEPLAYRLWVTVKSLVGVYQGVVQRAPQWLRLAVMKEDENSTPHRFLEPYENQNTNHAIGLQKIFMFAFRAQSAAQVPALWRLNPNQQEQLDAICATLSTNDVDTPTAPASELQTLCHEFWISLIEQAARYDPIEELPLITAICALSVRQEQFVFGYLFASELSAIKKWARMAVVYQVHTQGTQRDTTTETPYAARSNIITMATNLTHEYLSIHCPSTMEWVIHSNRYLASQRYGDTLDSFVTWSSSSRTLTCRHITLSMDAFQTLLRGMYEEATQKLLDLLFIQSLEDAPKIPWDDIKDTPGTSEPGYNIFDPQFNPVLKKGSTFVASQSRRALRGSIKTNNNTRRIAGWEEASNICAYGLEVELFKRLILPLVHLSAGQPARATELLSLHVSNTPNNELRNIFVIDGRVVIVLRWSKNQHHASGHRLAYRFLPRPVGTLVALYLWLVRPYYQVTQHHAQSQLNPTGDNLTRQANSPLLWSNKDGEQHDRGTLLSSALQQASSRYLQLCIGVCLWRHILIAIGRWVLDLKHLMETPDPDDITLGLLEEEADALEEKAGHSVPTGRNIYAQAAFSMFADRDTFSKHRRESERLHEVQGWNEITDGSASRALHHGIRYTQSAVPSHEPSGPGGVTTASHPNVPIEEDLTAETRKTEQRRATPPLGLLKMLHGNEAKFRPGQEEVFNLVLRRESPIVYVAGTGTGKSDLFLLSALIDKLVLVVVPLLALQRNLQQRCRDANIPCQLFDPSDPGLLGWTRGLMIAMPGTVKRRAFRNAISTHVHAGRLQYIFVDEFHYIFANDHEYRDDVRLLPHYLDLGARMCLLTATLPPSLEGNAWEILDLPHTPKHFIRVATTRSNINYVVRSITIPPADDRDAFLAHYIQTELTTSAVKTLVFVPYTNMAQVIAEAVGGAYMHSQMADTEKRRQMQRFEQGEVDILVGTPCIGEGWDFPGIASVIHVCPPASLSAYAQQSGRGGRGPGSATATLLVPSPSFGYLLKEPPSTQKPMLAYMQQECEIGTQRCRRQLLDSFLDGVEREPCRGNERQCDVCESRSNRGGLHSTSDKSGQGSPTVEVPQTPSPAPVSETSTDSDGDDTDTASETDSSGEGSTPMPPRAPVGAPVARAQVQPAKTGDKDMRRKRLASQRGSVNPDMNGLQSIVPVLTRTPEEPTESVATQVTRQAQESEQRRVKHRADMRSADYVMGAGLEKLLDFWGDNCPICWASSSDGTHVDWRHSAETCEVAQDNNCKARVNTFSYEVKPRPKGYCWFCMLPHSFCDRYNGTTEHAWTFKAGYNPGAGRRCRYPFTMRRAFYAIWKGDNEDARERAMKRASREAGGIVVYGTPSWLKYYQRTVQLNEAYLSREVWTVYNVSLELGLI